MSAVIPAAALPFVAGEFRSGWRTLALALEFDIAAYLVARYFGLRDYGRLFGLHLGVVTIGSALAPFGFAALLRDTGGYSAMLSTCAAACLLGPTLLLTLGHYPTRTLPPTEETP